MTPTLETALAGLPAKPRVHELSKRIGISNKEVLTLLAERGLTITSASASVPLPVAQELLTTLLGGEAAADVADTAEPAVAPEEPAADAPATPADTPAGADLAINPLFLPPAEVAPARPPRRRRAAAAPAEVDPNAAPADSDSATDATPEVPVDTEAEATGGRRRRGRSGKGRRGRPDERDATDAGPDTAAGSGTDGDTTEVATEPASAEAVNDGGEPGEADTPGRNSDAEADADTDSDELSGRGRRRRRGRRGRGRLADSDEEQSDATGGDTADNDAADATDRATGADDSSDTGADAQDDSDGDRDGDRDTDGGQVGSANRRRRRRRRRANGDETPREDDPDNTVVHVREPRLSQAATGGPGSGSGEVQGVRGSTRLEAKRQRRRDSRDSSRRRPQILTEAEFLARRESVERVMAVRQRGGLAQVALLEDGVLVEHFVSQTGSDSMIGSVFLGKVQNVLPSMEAAFVDIGRGRNAVIYAGEVNWDAAGLNGKARRIETALSSGDTILAQVSKDPVGHKGARLTTQISLPGRFVVYVPGGGATGISRKLPDTERKRLKSIMDRIVPEDAGVIIRTAAEGIAEDELARDVERLKSQWEEISRRASEKTSAPTQLYAEPGTLIKVVRDLFNSDITRLVVDGEEAYEPVAEYVNAVAPELADRLVRYESATPNGPDVFATYRIDEQIAKALERKVHLPSGGSLVIDRTEAMTVVDVNTGKYTGSGGNLEETVTKNNLEAAEEIVRQLRLRDIGGIIVVDFIDMVLESNRELVLRRLTEALGRDRTRHQVAEVTSLGLVQMTRKRMGTGLVEAFSEPCPHCGGRGIVLHDMPMVATAVDDAPAERRTGKSRRNRGREERSDDIVVPRVVEQAPGRRPDPRGPKPPIAAVGERGVSTGRDAARDTHRPVIAVGLSGDDAGEVDWIEAAASAGIAAADAADADDFEFGEPTSDAASEGTGDGPTIDAADGAPTAGGAPTADAAADSAAAGAASVEQDLQVVTEPAPIDVEASPPAATESAATEPAATGQAPAPSDGGGAVSGTAASSGQRPRRRRAAGRPAGAPAGTSGPVDIIVPEAAVTRADPSADGGAGIGTAGHGDATAATVGPSTGEPATGDQAPQNGHVGTDGAAPAASTPPRRRRAASRPAGPAAGDGAEPLVLSVPADQPPS
jgi:ribonuclease E